MASSVDSASRVINGTYGELYLNGRKIAEVSAFQLKIAHNKQEINLCGQYMTDYKATNGKGTGSFTLYKVDSGMIQEMDGMQEGQDKRYTLMGGLADPDSLGAERVAVYNVSFDDLTIADWAAAKPGSTTHPFTFTRYAMMDMIGVQ